MVNVILMSNTQRFKKICDEDSTILEILNDNNMDFSTGIVQVNGMAITALDTSIGALARPGDDGELKATLAVVAKSQNAAKIRTLGSATVIISDITKDQYDKAKKYAPDTLVLKDADGNELFMVSYKEGKPSFGPSHATFSEFVEDKLALAMLMPKDELLENSIKPLLDLTEVERQVVNAESDIDNMKQIVAGMFE